MLTEGLLIPVQESMKPVGQKPHAAFARNEVEAMWTPARSEDQHFHQLIAGFAQPRALFFNDLVVQLLNQWHRLIELPARFQLHRLPGILSRSAFRVAYIQPKDFVFSERILLEA